MQFKNSRLKILENVPEVLITEFECIHNQIDELGLIPQMSDDDFMLLIMSNLPEEYEAVLTDVENRLILESGEKITIELISQQLNAPFKTLQSKKDEVKEEEKALAAIKKHIEL